LGSKAKEILRCDQNDRYFPDRIADCLNDRRCPPLRPCARFAVLSLISALSDASRSLRQSLEVNADLEQQQIGTLRIVDEKPQMGCVDMDKKPMATKDEIEPGRGRFVANRIDDLHIAQQQRVVSDSIPSHDVWKLGKMARTVRRSFIQQSHKRDNSNKPE
jgi:hypothetical protein